MNTMNSKSSFTALGCAKLASVSTDKEYGHAINADCACPAAMVVALAVLPRLLPQAGVADRKMVWSKDDAGGRPTSGSPAERLACRRVSVNPSPTATRKRAMGIDPAPPSCGAGSRRPAGLGAGNANRNQQPNRLPKSAMPRQVRSTPNGAAQGRSGSLCSFSVHPQRRPLRRPARLWVRLMILR